MRGEGNHKIPGSFAPENMEKTGAERVKYSLACQHEDAISIKFVSYAQKCPTVLCTFAVALRKESVDRNFSFQCLFECPVVALRKESVDRNFHFTSKVSHALSSLSARRAWIEIADVGRSCSFLASLSARRAWIEISIAHLRTVRNLSLSARRAWIEIFLAPCYHPGRASRSPQGERG